jgi:hypothetical protein
VEVVYSATRDVYKTTRKEVINPTTNYTYKLYNLSLDN